MEQLSSYWTDFYENVYLSTFRNSVEEVKVSLKSGKECWVLYTHTDVLFWWHCQNFDDISGFWWYVRIFMSEFWWYMIILVTCQNFDDVSEIFCRMRNVAGSNFTQNQNTHFVFNNIFTENLSVFEIMWKNILERRRPQMAVRRMRVACWITRATNTHSEYVILCAFPLQQR